MQRSLYLEISIFTNNYMKKLFTTLCLCAALSFVGCVDHSFDIADVSGEVTIGGEELVLPLADVDNIYLGDLLKEEDVIKSDENGVYQIYFSSFGEDPTKYESLKIDGMSIPAITGLSPQIDPFKFSFDQMPTQLQLDGFSQTFNVDFPSVNDLVRVAPITVELPLDIKLPTILEGQAQGSIPAALVPYLPQLTSKYSNETVFNASITILKELKKIDFVEFGSKEHPYGAPFYINIDLNGLQNVNGGGTIKLNVDFPHGYYLRDSNGKDFPAATHNILNEEITIEKGQRNISLLVYLNKIDYSDHEFNEGLLVIDDHIKYGYDVSLNVCAGDYNLKNAPTFTLMAQPQYKDVEIVINHFELPELKHDISYTFEGLPSAISVEKIAFTKNTNLSVSLTGLSWCIVKDNLTDELVSPFIEIALPKCMRFRPNALLNAETNHLLASIADLEQGITLSLDHIDCTTEGIQFKDGTLSINETIAAAVHLESLDNHTILASSINPPKDLAIALNISDTVLEVDLAETKISWSEDQVYNFDLKDQVPSLSQVIEIPEMISSIECIEIGKHNSKEPVSMSFDLSVLNSKAFPVNEVEVKLSVNIGKMLRPTQECLNSGIIKKNADGDYILDINEIWSPNKSSLSKRISFEALENIPAIVDGKIKLEQTFPVEGSVRIRGGESIDLSGLDNTEININIHIDDIEVRTFTGGLNISVAPEEMVVELGELGNLGVNIAALSLNPILRVKLKDNPTGIPFAANIAVKTFAKDSNTPMQTITVPTINIAGNGASEIVLSTPRNAGKYEGTGVTFIAIEGLSELLKGELPSKIAVNMSVASDNSKNYTIDLLRAAEGYLLEYQYEAIVPMEFDGEVDMSYATTISDLNETFSALAEDIPGLKVGDIGLVAEFGSTIPFDLQLSAQLVNKDGTTDGIDAALNISNNGFIRGWTKADGENPRISDLEIKFDLGESQSLTALKNVDGIRLKFVIMDNGIDDIASLAKNQYLNGNIKLRIRDGLTIDIMDLLKNSKEE